MQLSLFPLNLVLFPGGPLPLRIFETRYVDMVRRCMHEQSDFGVVLVEEGKQAGPAATRDVGTTAKIVDFHQLSDGLLGLSCVGQRKFKIRSRRVQSDGLNVGEVDLLDPEPQMGVPEKFTQLAELVEGVLPQLGDAYTGLPMRAGDCAWVGHRLAEILPIELDQKQYCLELDDPVLRLEYLMPMMKFTARNVDADTPTDTH